LLATAGPWLLAWLLTYWEIAPIFHRRYVIASSVPLVLALISQLALVRLRWLRWLAVVIAGLCLCVEQGTWSVWRRGELIGSQRGEGWREATRWLNGQITAEDELWVASGLIEGQVVDLPLSERENVYLSFPLRGLYAIRDGRQEFLVEPQALVGEPTSWGEQLLLTSLVPQPSMPQPNAARRRVWLVYRGSAAALKRKSDRATEALPAAFQNWDISEIQQFGRVCVVRFEQR
jgi:hypothetical protein